MNVDLPAPGAPEMPIRIALPVCGSSLASSVSPSARCSARVDSISVIALASERRLPARTPAARASTSGGEVGIDVAPRDGRADRQACGTASLRAARTLASTSDALSGIGVPGP